MDLKTICPLAIHKCVDLQPHIFPSLQTQLFYVITGLFSRHLNTSKSSSHFRKPFLDSVDGNILTFTQADNLAVILIVSFTDLYLTNQQIFFSFTFKIYLVCKLLIAFTVTMWAKAFHFSPKLFQLSSNQFLCSSLAPPPVLPTIHHQH